MPLRAKILNPAFSTSSKMSDPRLPKEQPGDQPDDVLFGSIYGARTIQLNRPKKLNSLDSSMARKILPRLKEWEKSHMASVVIIGGAGEKAFCAGGDVAALAKECQKGKEGQEKATGYFGLEYQLDHAIATYTKPYVAYLDGITMGGGVGLSVHAPFRVATERTLFSMPETTIGFFPDVGGSFFLPRLDGYTGTYLALTSERLKGVNAFYAGIATHFMHSSALPDLTARLSELEFKDYDSREARLEAINATIEEFNTGLPHDEPILLAGEIRKAIDRCFRHTTVEAIIEALGREEGATKQWADATLKTISQRSPTSLKVTLRQMIVGKKWSISEAFQKEYHLASNFMGHPDFVEGVSARLMSKPPREPKWSPSTLAEVSDKTVDGFFLNGGKEDMELFSEVDYRDYEPRYGLPRESEIREQVKSGSQTREEVVDAFMVRTGGKLGVREKVEEVLNRMCAGEPVKWIDSKTTVQ